MKPYSQRLWERSERTVTLAIDLVDANVLEAAEARRLAQVPTREWNRIARAHRRIRKQGER